MTTHNDAIRFHSQVDYLGSEATAKYQAEVKQVLMWHESRVLLAANKGLLGACEKEIAELEAKAGKIGAEANAAEQHAAETEAALAKGQRTFNQLNRRENDELMKLEKARREASDEYNRISRQAEAVASDLAYARERAHMVRAGLRQLESMTPPETPYLDIIRNYKGGK